MRNATDTVPDSDDWVVEDFYFGNAVWPTDASWRSRGIELQYLVEREIHSFREFPDETHPTVLSEIESIKESFEPPLVDCFNKVIGDTLFFHGWLDKTDDPSARGRYEQDKKGAWK